MDYEKSTIEFSKLQQFLPLNLVPARFQKDLLENILLTPFAEYQNIIRYNENTKLSHYLLSGHAEIRHTFEHREKLCSDNVKCRYPLEELIKEGGVIRAITPCSVIIVNKENVEELIQRSQNEDYKIIHLDEMEASESGLIDDTYNDDWMPVFFQSNFAKHLSPIVLQQLFTEMEDIHVNPDQEIVQKETRGDYFYIIKEGYADVIVESETGYSRIELSPGNYFGDESLITNANRNATVVMMSEGVLGRINAKCFNHLIKKSLVIAPTPEQFEQFNDPIYYDVRTPTEYQRDHHTASENFPVSKIRDSINSFKSDHVYMITPEGGYRSELAVYLLRQAGIEAYYMDGLAAQNQRVNTA